VCPAGWPRVDEPERRRTGEDAPSRRCIRRASDRRRRPDIEHSADGSRVVAHSTGGNSRVMPSGHRSFQAEAALFQRRSFIVGNANPWIVKQIQSFLPNPWLTVPQSFVCTREVRFHRRKTDQVVVPLVKGLRGSRERALSATSDLNQIGMILIELNSDRPIRRRWSCRCAECRSRGND